MQCALLFGASRSDYDTKNIWIRSTMLLLTEHYADKISNVLSCYDRIIIQGTLPGFFFRRWRAVRLISPGTTSRAGRPISNQTRANACITISISLIESSGCGCLRVPTWCPFRLQFYFNGHNWLAVQLKKKGISFILRDNAFTEIDDWEKAQKLADKFDPASLHRRLDRLASTYCPIIKRLGANYHWSLVQTEFATDIVF